MRRRDGYCDQGGENCGIAWYYCKTRTKEIKSKWPTCRLHASGSALFDSNTKNVNNI